MGELDVSISERVRRLAGADCRVQVYGLRYDKWQVLVDRGNLALQRSVVCKSSE
ncbi:MAG: hypothetical protein JW751_20475 [Polyangiaceae bacterium]|nr:hypothetical protein [Polyangiaceae bacterium]